MPYTNVNEYIIDGSDISGRQNIATTAGGNILATSLFSMVSSIEPSVWANSPGQGHLTMENVQRAYEALRGFVDEDVEAYRRGGYVRKAVPIVKTFNTLLAERVK